MLLRDSGGSILRAMPSYLLRGVGVLLLGTVVAACAPDPPVAACASLLDRARGMAVTTSEDTLDLPVVLLASGPGEPGEVELLVRVDPVEERGIVRFGSEGAPPPAPTVAAAGVILAPGSRYRVCLGKAPAALAFQAETAPTGKIWARVSTDRPVRAWVQGPGDGAGAPASALRIAPGSSGREVFLPGGGG